MADVLGYARVSTAGQDLEGLRQRLEAARALRIFQDVVSGRNFDRPGLRSLLEFARPGDTICVVRLDRLGRSLIELIGTVEVLKQRGIGLMSLEEKIDTSSAAGELVFHIFGSLAEFERKLIADRTRDGLKAARAKGQKFGRPAVESEKLDAALKLVDAGLRPKDAAHQVGVGRSTLYREIQSRRSQSLANNVSA